MVLGIQTRTICVTVLLSPDEFAPGAVDADELPPLHGHLLQDVLRAEDRLQVEPRALALG